MWFLFGQYLIIPKMRIGHNQKGTTLEPLAKFLATDCRRAELVDSCSVVAAVTLRVQVPN